MLDVGCRSGSSTGSDLLTVSSRRLCRPGRTSQLSLSSDELFAGQSGRCSCAPALSSWPCASLLAGQIFHLGFAAYFCFHFGLFLFQLLLCGHFLSRLRLSSRASSKAEEACDDRRDMASACFRRRFALRFAFLGSLFVHMVRKCLEFVQGYLPSVLNVHRFETFGKVLGCNRC